MQSLSLPNMPAEVAARVRQVPVGKLTTPGAIAGSLGSSMASRWVGSWLVDHTHDEACPCHRVVRADGSLGGYITGEPREKAIKLAREGIEIACDRIAPEILASKLLRDFTGEAPLNRLQQLQDEARYRVKLTPPEKPFASIAGVDVSYVPIAKDAGSMDATDNETTARVGVAAYALVAPQTGELLWSHTIARPVEFPYISSFLSFRELPLLLELIDAVRKDRELAEAIVVDGTGILHPRRIGIASHFGVLIDHPTIGLTKKLLCGRVDLQSIERGEYRPVMDDSETIGEAFLAPTGSQRPLYVSPGHLVDVATARKILTSCRQRWRLPAPIYWADKISRAEARRLAEDKWK